ncbi:hypothetical protein [Uliginosibacterium sediminicola]|uniref:Uncharacterized protein n=1 Tax=Uliginosibacterium sediminicola TaxID=2024550 RepID=A0ABU9Z261_9RHOO
MKHSVSSALDELRALADMPDEDINYDDIPQQSAEQIAAMTPSPRKNMAPFQYTNEALRALYEAKTPDGHIKVVISCDPTKTTAKYFLDKLPLVKGALQHFRQAAFEVPSFEIREYEWGTLQFSSKSTVASVTGEELKKLAQDFETNYPPGGRHAPLKAKSKAPRKTR